MANFPFSLSFFIFRLTTQNGVGDFEVKPFPFHLIKNIFGTDTGPNPSKKYICVGVLFTHTYILLINANATTPQQFIHSFQHPITIHG